VFQIQIHKINPDIQSHCWVMDYAWPASSATHDSQDSFGKKSEIAPQLRKLG